MAQFHEQMKEYRKQLEKGDIQAAYRGLMQYMMDLRTYFQKQYPVHTVSGSIYFGYMDMTYFAFIPQFLKERKLKIAILFNHEPFRFEAWLVGNNRKIQAAYYKLISESGWDKYAVVAPGKGIDAIVEHILVEDPNFSDLDALSAQIERGVLAFTRDVEGFLAGL